MQQTTPHYVRFENRAFLALSGPDKHPFLNALLAGSISALSPARSLYTVLLTPQGRLRCDLFITPWDEDLWILEVAAERKDDLLRQLTLYKLRSAITLQDVSADYAVFGIFPQTTSSEPGETSAPSTAQRLYTDPRKAHLGQRLLIHTASGAAFPEETTDLFTYHRHRILCHAPEAGIDMPYEKAIPLECGLDTLNAIDWEKGCYVGQELTARTRYRGLVRKKLIPVRLESCPSSDIPNDLTITTQTGEVVGEMRGVFGDLGTIFVRLDALPTPENDAALFYQQTRLSPLSNSHAPLHTSLR